MLRALGTLAFCTTLLGLSGCFEDTTLPDGITEAAGTDTATETNTDTTDTGPNAADCMTYCGLVGTCDTNPQYGDMGPCMNVCMNMDLGSVEDQTGNTVGCRTHYAILAAECGDMKELNCRRAGPSGDGACGSPCESFCRIASTTCTGESQIFPSEGDCVTACMQWPDMPLYDASVPEADTYACRLKHLTYATLAPAVHCSHAQAMSPVCL